MRYTFNPRTGRVRGNFTVHNDFEGKELPDGSFEVDLLAFRYGEDADSIGLLGDDTQLYISFANIAIPAALPLLEKEWIAFNDFRCSQCRQPDDTGCDFSRLVEFAEKSGPLFGVFDEGTGHITKDQILEPESCWYDAAKTLSLAIRIQAWLAGRTDGSDLDDVLYFTLHTGRKEEEFYWECASFFPDQLASPYFEMLELEECERERLFLPASDVGFPDLTFVTLWKPHGHGLWNHSSLRVSAVPSGMSETTVPVAYASFSYMIDNPETEPIARALVAHLVRGLVVLHTHRAHHDLHDGFFGVVYNNLLEKLWMDFGADAALGKLGVCDHCGDVFEAMSERKDVKRYCSVTCQANAKSARQYRRRKIREAIASECSNNAHYLLHYLDDPTITLELVEEVLNNNHD